MYHQYWTKWRHVLLDRLQCRKVHLTHWCRVIYICGGRLIIIGSDNGLSPERRQAIFWTNAGIFSIWHLGKNFSEILNEIHTFSLKKIFLKMSSVQSRPFCLGLNLLMTRHQYVHYYHLIPRDHTVYCSSCCFVGVTGSIGLLSGTKIGHAY